MNKRLNSIVAVTVATYATVYVEAETPEEAAQIVRDNIDEIYNEMPEVIDGQFEESDIEVDSYETYTTEPADYMQRIWTTDGEALTFDEYWDECHG